MIIKKSLNRKAANDVLQNVFEQCNVAPNSTPFDKIMLRSMAETKIIAVFRYIAIGLLAILLLAPLAFRRDESFVILETSKHVSIENHALYDDHFVLTLSGSNIDYSNIYAKSSDGAYIFPASIDKNSGIVTFPYNGEALNIYIPSGENDMIQAVLSETK